MRERKSSRVQNVDFDASLAFEMRRGELLPSDLAEGVCVLEIENSKQRLTPLSSSFLPNHHLAPLPVFTSS